MPYPVLSLDDPTCRRLEALCRRALPIRRDPAGPAPAHETLISQRLETTWVRTWRFPTEGAARAWNADWERAMADPHHRHPALLEPMDALRSDPALDLVARIASAVLHEEIHAGTPPPEVSAGGGFELTVRHEYEVRPFPIWREELLIHLSWHVLDAAGEPTWAVDCAREYDLRHLPANAAPVLMRPTRTDALEAIDPG